jgi:hypothetical protein
VLFLLAKAAMVCVVLLTVFSRFIQKETVCVYRIIQTV